MVRPVYLLPDGLAYDRGAAVAESLGAQFEKESVYRGWYENYHTMTFSPTVEDWSARLARRKGCGAPVVGLPKNERVSELLAVERTQMTFVCRGQLATQNAILYRGRLTSLEQRKVYRLLPRVPGR